MSIPSARAKLKDSYRVLMNAWTRTNETWDDPVSQALYEKHLAPLESTLRSALTAMDTVNEVLERVRRDCDEERL
jgi:hypothetical protein